MKESAKGREKDALETEIRRQPQFKTATNFSYAFKVGALQEVL